MPRIGGKGASVFRVSTGRLCSDKFNVDESEGMLELTHPDEPSRQLGLTNRKNDFSSISTTAWRSRHALKAPPLCRVVRVSPWVLVGNHLSTSLELAQWCDIDDDEAPPCLAFFGGINVECVRCYFCVF